MQTDLATEDHQRRVRYLAAFYPWLQGLRFLPMAVLFGASAVWLVSSAAGETPLRLGAAYLLPALIGFVAQIPISAWYRRTFGQATMAPRNKKALWLAALVSALFGVVVSQAMVQGPQVIIPPWYAPLTLGLAAVACAGFYWFTGRVATHYSWIGAAALLLAAPHLAGVSPFCAAATALHAPGVADCHFASLLFYLSVLMVPAAVFDHRLLARTFSRRGEEAG